MSAPKDAVADVVEALGGEKALSRGDVRVISRGGPCKCGPGFCAKSRCLAMSGACRGPSEAVKPAPDCPKCGAPHQSDAGCWLCSTSRPIRPEDEAWTAEYNAGWLRLLEAGIGGPAVSAVQASTWLDFPEAVEVAIGQFPRQYPVDTRDDGRTP